MQTSASSHLASFVLAGILASTIGAGPVVASGGIGNVETVEKAYDRCRHVNTITLRDYLHADFGEKDDAVCR